MSGPRLWPMEESGVVVKTAEGVGAARAAYIKYLSVGGEGDGLADADDLRDHAERATAREGWYRWTPCSPRSCYDHGQHRPGHLQRAEGPGRGAWRGVTLDCP
jgi:hypothetical protein